MDQFGFKQEIICVDFEDLCDAISEFCYGTLYFFYDSEVEYRVLIYALETLGYKWANGANPWDWQPGSRSTYRSKGSLAIMSNKKQFICGIIDRPDDKFYLEVKDFTLEDDIFDVSSDSDLMDMLMI